MAKQCVQPFVKLESDHSGVYLAYTQAEPILCRDRVGDGLVLLRRHRFLRAM